MTKLYTAYGEYFATGEGHTAFALIAYAADEAAIKAKAKEQFGEWFARGVDVREGLVRNKITKHLFSESLLDRIERAEDVGNIDVHSSAHFNFS